MSSKAVRYVLTPTMMMLGALGGYWVATNYLQFLANPGSDVGSPFWSWINDFLALGGKPDLLTQSIMLATLVVIGLLVGMVLSVVIYKQLQRMREGLQDASPQEKIAVGSGLFLGLLLSVLVIAIIAPKMPTGPRVVVALVLSYLGVVATMSVKEQMRWFFPGVAAAGASGAKSLLQRPKILDTNVIIDGRIADVCRVGFVEGPIFIPRFVLEELQQIADSAESLKRARGRRGLDILNAMQKELQLQVKEYEETGIEEVDAKLVNLAQRLGGAIVTNDFNLNKVAELQGVQVLNVNELANALKPVVLPGEEMSVAVIKEGKEQSQGIGYLDDGTMVVVEGAKRRIGETLGVVVTSVLQTVAGKMIFATIKASGEEQEGMIDRNVRNNSGGRPRKKIR